MDASLSRSWSPATRPTVNTSIPNHHPSASTSSELSPHPSAHSSPWSQNVPLGSAPSSSHFPMSQPLTASRGGISSEHANSMQSLSNDWANIFSAPLNPTVFAALAANGVLGPPPGQPASLPSSSFHNHFHPPNPRHHLPNIDVMVQPSATGQWSESPVSYTPSSSYTSKPVLPRSNSSSSNVNQKSRLSGSSSQYASAHPRPLPMDDRRQAGRHHSRSSLSSAGSIHRSDGGPGSIAFDHALHSALMSPASPLDYNPGYSYTGEKTHVGLPPSLWMSPASTAPSTPGALEAYAHSPLSSVSQTHSHFPSSNRSSFAQSPSSPTSPSLDSKSTIFTDIFSDELFGAQGASQATSPYTSPRLSGSPDLQPTGLPDGDPEQLAKDDPLATQVWKMYARTKATLPHAQRMENLTWRMMALALKKKKEDEAREAAELMKQEQKTNKDAATAAADSALKAEGKADSKSEGSPDAGDAKDSDERGRRIDKGKSKVRVVGFDGTNQDGDEPDE